MQPKNKVWYIDDSHSYYADEAMTQMIPYYSAIVKEVLGNQFENIPSHILEAARERGSDIHHATHMLDIGESFKTEFPGHVEQWERFKLDFGIHDKKFDLIEEPLFCKSLWYGITPDRFIGETLIELKINYKISSMSRIQTAGQSLAIEENYNFKVKKRMVVNLSESTYKTEIHNNPKDFEYWKAIVKTFQYKMFEK